MRGGFGPRFVAEAIFLVAVATVAGLAQFPTTAIVLVMALAWLLVAGVEWAVARTSGADMGRRRARGAAHGTAPDGMRAPTPEPQHVRVVPTDTEPTAQPVIARAPEQMPEPTSDAAPMPEPVSPTGEQVLAEPTPGPERAAVEAVVAAQVEPGIADDADLQLEEPEPVEPEPVEPDAVQPEPVEPDAVEPEPVEPEPEEPEPEEPEPGEPEPRTPEHVAAPGRTAEARPPAAAPVLTPVPTPEPEPEPAAASAAPHDDTVVQFSPRSQTREWNLWELERLARERAGHDIDRDEEWSYLLMYLRDFASPEGTLPPDFDTLVRESFGELIATR